MSTAERRTTRNCSPSGSFRIVTPDRSLIGYIPALRPVCGATCAARYSKPMPGEFDFINWLRAQHPPSGFVPVPQGDDLAVLKWQADDLLLVGVDKDLAG